MKITLLITLTLFCFSSAWANPPAVSCFINQLVHQQMKLIEHAEIGKSDVQYSFIIPKRRKHILYGDNTTGGHMWPGKKAYKSFPKEWDEDKILNIISSIILDPKVKWKPKPLPRNPNLGLHKRYAAAVQRENIKIMVILEPDGEGVITAFPLDK